MNEFNGMLKNITRGKATKLAASADSIFAVTYASCDDDGNVCTGLIGLFNTEEKALAAIKNDHDNEIIYFNDPEDDFVEGDRSYTIYEADDPIVCRTVCLTVDSVK